MNGSLLFVPSGGLANRMRAVASAHELCKKVDSTLQVVWFQDWALSAPFHSIFEETPLVAIREATILDHGVGMWQALLYELLPGIWHLP